MNSKTIHPYFIFLFLLAVGPWHLYSDPHHSKKQDILLIDAEKAVSLAIKNNHHIPIWKSMVSESQSRLKDAGSLSQPQLTLTTRGERAMGLNDENSSEMSIQIEQSFPMGHQRKFERSISDLNLSYTKLETQLRLHELAKDVELKFVEIMSIQKKIELVKKIFKLNTELTGFLQSRSKLGEVSSIDVGEAEIEKNFLEQELLHLHEKFAKQLSILKQMICLPETTELRLLFKSKENFTELSAKAAERIPMHPEIQLQKMKIKLAGKSQKLKKAERWGDWKMGLNWKREREIESLIKSETSQQLGLKLNVPLPLRKNKRGAIEAASLAIHRERQELKVLKEELSLEEKRLRTRDKLLEKQLRHMDQSVLQNIKKNMTIHEQAYSQGQINLDRLIRMHEQSLKAQQRRLEILSERHTIHVKWKSITSKSPVSLSLP